MPDSSLSTSHCLMNGKYLAECIDTGWISSEGPFVRKFESEFASRLGQSMVLL